MSEEKRVKVKAQAGQMMNWDSSSNELPIAVAIVSTATAAVFWGATAGTPQRKRDKSGQVGAAKWNQRTQKGTKWNTNQINFSQPTEESSICISEAF